MKRLDTSLRAFTFKARSLAAGILVTGCAIVFGGLLFSGALATLTRGWGPLPSRLFYGAVPLIAMAGVWFALGAVAHKVLKTKYPTARLARTQNIGKTGPLAIAAIGVIYLVFYLLAPAS